MDARRRCEGASARSVRVRTSPFKRFDDDRGEARPATAAAASVAGLHVEVLPEERAAGHREGSGRGVLWLVRPMQPVRRHPLLHMSRGRRRAETSTQWTRRACVTVERDGGRDWSTSARASPPWRLAPASLRPRLPVLAPPGPTPPVRAGGDTATRSLRRRGRGLRRWRLSRWRHLGEHEAPPRCPGRLPDVGRGLRVTDRCRRDVPTRDERGASLVLLSPCAAPGLEQGVHPLARHAEQFGDSPGAHPVTVQGARLGDL